MFDKKVPSRRRFFTVMCKYWVLSEHSINDWFYQNSNYIQLLRNVSADKARHTWVVKKRDGLGGRRLEGTGFLQNTHPLQSRLPQETVWVSCSASLCFLGSASDHLSERRLSRVCLVTMRVRSLWCDLLPTSWAVIWCSRSMHSLAAGTGLRGLAPCFHLLGCHLFPSNTPYALFGVVIRTRGFRNQCTIQILSCDAGSARCWGNTSPGAAETEWAAWQGIGWPQKELRGRTRPTPNDMHLMPCRGCRRGWEPAHSWFSKLSKEAVFLIPTEALCGWAGP